MAVITPNTDVYLLKVPLEIDEMNQLTFASAEAQFNYFNSLPKIVVEDYTYQRKDNTIRFGANFDEIISYNYVMYRNTEYSDKWFYAFITNTEYVNDNMSTITIKTDVWQTYQFDLTFKPVLIDREHTNDDTIGKNTLPEGLELGEMVANGNTVNFGLSTVEDSYMVIVDVSMIENPGQNQTLTYSWNSGGTPPSFANGIPSGTYHVIVGDGSLIIPDVQHLISIYDKAGLSDAIQNVYILPSNIVSQASKHEGLTISTTGSAPSDSMSNLAMVSGRLRQSTNMGYGYLERPNTVDNYTPRNNKVLCYPFNYFNVSNNGGTTIPYHYEDFESISSSVHRVQFDVEGVFTPSGSIKAIPANYKRLTENTDNAYEYSINGAKYPICSWNSDSYTNWLTQNAVNMQTEWKTAGIATLLGMGAGAIKGTIAGGVVGGVVGLGTGILENGGGLIKTAREQMLAKTEANLVPDQSKGNLNAGDLVFSKWGCAFTFMPMSVKAEYARCADDYFDMFGYATNRVKLPNITGRRNWNYVKTVGCYIEADIPQSDLQEIKDMFDRGVTFWHNPSTFMDYTQNNDII